MIVPYGFGIFGYRTTEVPMETIPDPRVADLLRVGKIRVALFLPLYKNDPITGELRPTAPEGVCLVEIARALTAQLGVDLQLIGYPTPPGAMNALKAAECDIGFFGIDPSRATEIDFSPPLVQADFTYLVPTGSLIRRSADADRLGVTVAVVRNHSSTNALSRILRHAKLIYGETPEETLNLLCNGRADAMASVRSALLEFSISLPGSHVLDDRYGELLLAIAMPKNKPEWLAYVREFVNEAKASGLVQRAIESTGARGLQVAPPGNTQSL
jgi:polar amino acid transport system substrate-binding protein